MEDITKKIQSYKDEVAKHAKPKATWTVEVSQKVPSLYKGDDLFVERTLKEGSDVRVLRLRKGNRFVAFDIEASHIVAISIKQISEGFVPDELKEEAVKE